MKLFIVLALLAAVVLGGPGDDTCRPIQYAPFKAPIRTTTTFVTVVTRTAYLADGRPYTPRTVNEPDHTFTRKHTVSLTKYTTEQSTSIVQTTKTTTKEVVSMSIRR